MDDPNPQKNRRGNPRRNARAKVKVGCYKGSMDMGPNLGVSLLDVSESGVRLIVKTALPGKQEVLITLEGRGHNRPIKLPGVVVWCQALEGGNCALGVRLDKFLDYRDLLEVT